MMFTIALSYAGCWAFELAELDFDSHALPFGSSFGAFFPLYFHIYLALLLLTFFTKDLPTLFHILNETLLINPVSENIRIL